MALPKNIIQGFSGTFLIALSILFLFFIILPGATDSTPFDHTYFLRADTSGITGARDVSQWTFLFICGRDNTDCRNSHAAIPFGYAWDSRAENVPPGLGGNLGNHTTAHKIFYLWRFGWVFLLLTLFFEILAFGASFFSCFGRLGSALAFLVSGVALFFFTIAIGLTTATFVKARNRFKDANREASLGAWGFGWLWAGYVALLVAVVLFALGIRKARPAKKGGPLATGPGPVPDGGGRRVKEGDYS